MTTDIKVTVSWTDDNGQNVRVPIAFRDDVSTTHLVSGIADLANKSLPQGKPRIDAVKAQP